MKETCINCEKQFTKKGQRCPFRSISNDYCEEYVIECYDIYGHCDVKREEDFNKAVEKTLKCFNNIDYQIVRMISPYQEKDVIYMSKIGY